MQEDLYETKIKLSKFWLMIYNCFQIFGCVYILYRVAQSEMHEHNKDLYIDEDSKIRQIFRIVEVLPFLELIHHLVGISKMKTHIFINLLTHIWILFGVIEFNKQSDFVIHWIVVRCINKIIRHFYNAYIAMDLKYEIYLIDYIRMSSYYFLYVLEYIYSLILVVVTLPIIRDNKIWQRSMPNFFNFNFDYQVIYFFYICASLPNFINTFVYLHRKRKQQLHQAKIHAKND